MIQIRGRGLINLQACIACNTVPESVFLYSSSIIHPTAQFLIIKASMTVHYALNPTEQTADPAEDVSDSFRWFRGLQALQGLYGAESLLICVLRLPSP